MRISTKGRYALRMLVDLAEHTGDGYVTLKEIAARQNISKQYLEQIVSLLNGADILRASRGKSGGYKLAKQPSEYSIGQIIRITEGSLTPAPCLDDAINKCDRYSSCRTVHMWSGLYNVITEYLDGITLQDLLDQYATNVIDDYII